MTDWYKKEATEVASLLATDAQAGLTEAEARRRLAEHGPNELVERGLKSPWRILWDQLTGLMVVILIVAAAISGALGDWKDAIAILAIVVLNAALGFSQEFRAEKAMAALKKLAVPRSRCGVTDSWSRYRPASWYRATWCCWKPGRWCRPTAAC